ncbi:Fc.00g080210.m01.CDS01 [Cosmosporella sp. VM-42]
MSEASEHGYRDGNINSDRHLNEDYSSNHNDQDCNFDKHTRSISLDPTTIGTVTTTTTTETSTYSSLSIVSETTTKTETDPVTLTITESSSTTTSEPFIHTFCAAEKREVSSGWGALQHEKRAEYYLPRDCSCFLTSTMLNVKEATYTTTITKPMTKTKTEITGGLVPTSTSTITKKTTVSVPGSTLVRLTSTSTSTKTVTSTKTSSTISTSTSTQVTTTTSQAKTTSTTTSTSTSTINHPCEPTNIDSILSPFTIYFFFNAALTELPTRPDDPTPCCYQCWTRKGCFAWAFEGQNGRCQLFSAPDDLPSYLCQTDQCPKGYQRLPWLPDPSDPRIWGAGYCGYDIHDGNIT